MRREDREGMRGKTQEDHRSDRDENAKRQSERMNREQMRGSAEGERQEKPERPSGRLPLPD